MGISGDDARTLCEVYGTDKELTEALAELARQSRRRGWWYVYDNDVLGKAADLVELEADARKIRSFTIDLVPGLLQTAEYAAAIIRLGYPSATRDEVEQRVALRMERQQRAWDAGVHMWAVLGEAALIQPIGGPDVMAAQLDHLMSLVTERAVTVQVLPLSLPGHAAMGVPFALLDLRDGATFGYLDTLTGGLTFEEAVDIETYGSAWDQLTANAVDFHQSESIMRQRALEHRS